MSKKEKQQEPEIQQEPELTETPEKPEEAAPEVTVEDVPQVNWEE